MPDWAREQLVTCSERLSDTSWRAHRTTSQEFPGEFKQLLAHQFNMQIALPGEFIYALGEEAHCVYFVAHGQVRSLHLFRTGPRGRLSRFPAQVNITGLSMDQLLNADTQIHHASSSSQMPQNAQQRNYHNNLSRRLPGVETWPQ